MSDTSPPTTGGALILSATKLLSDRCAEFCGIEDTHSAAIASALAALVQVVGAQAMALCANGIGEKAALGVFSDSIASKLKDRPLWPAPRVSEVRQVWRAAFACKLGAADEKTGVPAALATIGGLKPAVEVARAALNAAPDGEAAAKPEPTDVAVNAQYLSATCAEVRQLLDEEFVKLEHAIADEKGARITRLVTVLASCLKLANDAKAKAGREAKKALNGSK